MNQQNPDVTLGDTTPTTSSAPASTAPIGLQAGGAFGDPTGAQGGQHAAVTDAPREWTIEEILTMARLPEKRAHVCLRADLQARHDDLMRELAALVDAEGKLLEDSERAIGETSAAARAQALQAEADQVRAEMLKAMWHPLFRGMHSDEFMVFTQKHLPKPDKNGDVELTEYHVQLVARCATDPDITVERVRELRTKLGSRAWAELRETARAVCLDGGVDVPLSSSSWLAQEQ